MLQFYGAHDFTALSKCSTTEATTAILASKDEEAICHVTPHSCVSASHAGNGARRAECFPRIGLKVNAGFKTDALNFMSTKWQAKLTLPDDSHHHSDHIHPLQLSHPISAIHCEWLKLHMSVLSARSHLATVEIHVIQEASAAAILRCSRFHSTFQV